jgi:hypothetical protein
VRSRKLQLVVAAVGGVIAALVIRHVLSGGEVTDRQFFFDLIDRVAVAAEKRQIKEVRRWLSAHYRDDRGRTHEDINQLLILHLLRGGTLSVYVVDKDVVIHPRAPHLADVNVIVMLTRGGKARRPSDILPRAARALDFEMTFEKEGPEQDSWRLTSATWQRIRDVRDLLR